MADPIILPEDRPATLWNHYGAMGAKIGVLSLLAVAAVASIIGGMGAFAGITSGWMGVGAALVTGMVLGTSTYAGCIKGKTQIERNQLLGRPIEPPTLNNNGLYDGLINGAIVGLAAVTAVALATYGVTTGTIIPALLPATIGAAAMGTAFSGYYVADRQRDKMGLDYMRANIISQQLQAQAKGESKGFELSNLISGPDKATQAVPTKQANDNKVTMADVAALSAKLQEGRKPAALRLAESQAEASTEASR